MYREIIRYEALISPEADLTNTTAHLLVTTLPNMRFQIYENMFILTTVSGVSVVPTISMGVVGPNYTDQIASQALTSLASPNGSLFASASGTNAKSVAPSTGIFIKAISAATATTYKVRVVISGVYY